MFFYPELVSTAQVCFSVEIWNFLFELPKLILRAVVSTGMFKASWLWHYMVYSICFEPSVEKLRKSRSFKDGRDPRWRLFDYHNVIASTGQFLPICRME